MNSYTHGQSMNPSMRRDRNVLAYVFSQNLISKNQVKRPPNKPGFPVSSPTLRRQILLLIIIFGRAPDTVKISTSLLFPSAATTPKTPYRGDDGTNCSPSYAALGPGDLQRVLIVRVLPFIYL